MEPSEKKTFLRYFSVEFGIILVVIIIILGILSYLGVLPGLPSIKNPLSKETPSQGNKVNQAAPTAQVDEKGYGCIFTGKLCTQGETITAENKPAPTFYGIGFTNIPKETPIKAAISGRIGIGLSTDPKTGNKINLLTVTNDSQHLEADYRFVGKPYEPTGSNAGSIKKGDIIGWLGDSSVTFRQNPKTYKLIFFVMDLSSKDFKKLQFSDLK